MRHTCVGVTSKTPKSSPRGLVIALAKAEASVRSEGHSE